MLFVLLKIVILNKILLQDLPPKGGYAPINYKRIPARQIVNGK